MELYIIPGESSIHDELRKLYKDKILKQNNAAWKYYNYGGYADSGFDLFTPPPPLNVNGGTDSEGNITWTKSWDGKWVISPRATVKIPLGIKLVRTDENYYLPVGLKESDTQKENARTVPFCVYPRSSISKTPLRLANSVGIIDSGYRGELIAVFDNRNETPYEIPCYARLVQACRPDLLPFGVNMVDNDFNQTERGAGGFGSTGQ